jgi:hypothetical protein
VATEVDELVEGDGVDVFWFVERDQKGEGILGEFVFLEDGVLPQKTLLLRMSL